MGKWRTKLIERIEGLKEIKRICKIIFIDDLKFPVVDILKNSGWSNTSRLKDVDSLDQQEIREAHILFVDIQGVGKKLKFEDEGLGLIVALKQKYPSKKVIAYSAEDQGHVTAFHRGMNEADNRLSKNADPYQFLSLVERLSKEAFSLHECIERLKHTILKEYGRTYESEKIIKDLTKIYNKKSYDVKTISKVFNLNNAASVASIVQIFLKG